MPNVPNINDINRAKRAALSRFSISGISLSKSAPGPNNIQPPVPQVTPTPTPSPTATPTPTPTQSELLPSYFFANTNNETVSVSGDDVLVIAQSADVQDIVIQKDGESYRLQYVAGGQKAKAILTLPNGESYDINFGERTFIYVNGEEQSFYLLTNQLGGTE